MGRTLSPVDEAWNVLQKSVYDEIENYGQQLDTPRPIDPAQTALTDFGGLDFEEAEDDMEFYRPADYSYMLKPQFPHIGILHPDQRHTFHQEQWKNIRFNEDDLKAMHGMHQDDFGFQLGHDAFIRSAFDPNIENGLLNLGLHNDAKEIRDMVTRSNTISHQTKLGRFHPQFPNPVDLAWVQPSPDHSPELAARIAQESKNPAGIIRVTPETTSSDRPVRDPKTGKTKFHREEDISPKLKTTGHPVMDLTSSNFGFEQADSFNFYPEQRTFSDDQPGMFATTPSLRDIGKITTGHSWGANPNFVGVRGSPKDERMLIRTPREAKENLHELYLLDHQPADKIFDAMSLIPGRKRMNFTQGRKAFNMSEFQDIANALSMEHILPAVSAGLDREGKPMTIHRDELEKILHEAREHVLENEKGLWKPDYSRMPSPGTPREIDGVNTRNYKPTSEDNWIRKRPSFEYENEENLRLPSKKYLSMFAHGPSFDQTNEMDKFFDKTKKDEVDIADIFAHSENFIPNHTKDSQLHMGNASFKNAKEKLILEFLSEKYDLPMNALMHSLGEFSNRNRGLGDFQTNTNFFRLIPEELAKRRYVYNAAKASGIQFHPTQEIMQRRDEHGFPLATGTENQLSSKALEFLFPSTDKYDFFRGGPMSRKYGPEGPEHQGRIRPGSADYYRNFKRRLKRDPILPKQGEEIEWQPPTNEEAKALGGMDKLWELMRPGERKPDFSRGDRDFFKEILSQGYPEAFKQAINELRAKRGGIPQKEKKRRRGDE